MAVETLSTVTARIRLENGQSASGEMQYKNQSVQYISGSGYDASKLLAVVGAVEPILNKTIGGLHAIKTYSVSAG